MSGELLICCFHPQLCAVLFVFKTELSLLSIRSCHISCKLLCVPTFSLSFKDVEVWKQNIKISNFPWWSFYCLQYVWIKDMWLYSFTLTLFSVLLQLKLQNPSMCHASVTMAIFNFGIQSERQVFCSYLAWVTRKKSVSIPEFTPYSSDIFRNLAIDILFEFWKNSQILYHKFCRLVFCCHTGITIYQSISHPSYCFPFQT